MTIAERFLNSSMTAPYNTQWYIMMYGNRVKDTIYFKDNTKVRLNDNIDWEKF